VAPVLETGNQVVCTQAAISQTAGHAINRTTTEVSPKRGKTSPPMSTNAVDVQIIAALGEALYGPWWRRHVARAIGVHECSISRWLQGRGRPTFDDLYRLCAIARKRYSAILKAHQAGLELLKLLPPPAEEMPASKPPKPVVNGPKPAAPVQAPQPVLQPIKSPTIHGPVLPGRPSAPMRRPQ